MEPLPLRTPPPARSRPQAGPLWASPTRFSGRCTSSSLLPSWRSTCSAAWGCVHCAVFLTALLCVLRYNVVFRYLLSVRRVQSQLQHCWALQMQRKHLKSSQSDAVKWRLRNHMAFLIDNLQYYLQVTAAALWFTSFVPSSLVTEVFVFSSGERQLITMESHS